ncbi:MAG: type IX secretion system plug protein domain-containing protein, partial [Bacteroidota bacterium]
MTIEFDMRDDQPARIGLRFYHCDRNWNRTETTFINDEHRNRTRTELPFEPAPFGIQHYRYQYVARIPSFPLFEKFETSGNYEFDILDEEKREVIGRGRFFVAENMVTPQVHVRNRQDPSAPHPFNQVHRIDVVIPEPDSSEIIQVQQVTTVDLVRNKELGRSWRIDVHNLQPNTFVEGHSRFPVRFMIDNIPAGNEYRRLDLRNIDFYPPGRIARPRLGPDVSRFLKQGDPDNNGGAVLVRGSRYADYLEVQFELLLDEESEDPVYVAGDFTQWQVAESARMSKTAGRYVWTTRLRRGIHNYLYIVGGGDWHALEGNDWRTVSEYTALIYLRDPRFGGFDRIVGIGRALSEGANGPTAY